MRTRDPTRRQSCKQRCGLVSYYYYIRGATPKPPRSVRGCDACAVGLSTCGRQCGDLDLRSKKKVKKLQKLLIFTAYIKIPELIRGFPGIRGFPRNGPSRAGQALGSTRAGGQDDGSLHKLPQIISPGKTTITVGFTVKFRARSRR